MVYSYSSRTAVVFLHWTQLLAIPGDIYRQTARSTLFPSSKPEAIVSTQVTKTSATIDGSYNQAQIALYQSHFFGYLGKFSSRRSGSNSRGDMSTVDITGLANIYSWRNYDEYWKQRLFLLKFRFCCRLYKIYLTNALYEGCTTR